jgi:hypothetical protein
MRAQQRDVTTRQRTATRAASQRHEAYAGDARANSGTASSDWLLVCATQGRMIHSATIGTKTTPMTRSSGSFGDRMGIARECRFTLTIMTPTPNQ